MNRPDLGISRDLGQILDGAFGLLRAHGRTLLPLALAVVVPVNLLVSGIVGGQLTSGYESSPDVPILLLGAIVTYLVAAPIITAITVRVVLDAAAGTPVSAGRAASAGRRDFLALVAALALVVAGVLAGFVFILPGIYLGILWTFTAQAVVVDRRRGRSALSRSAELVRGRWWWVFGVLLTTNLIASLLRLVVTVPADALADAADSQAVALLGTMLSQSFALSLLALTSTLLYFSLRVRSGEGEPRAAGDVPAVVGGFAPPQPGGG